MGVIFQEVAGVLLDRSQSKSRSLDPSQDIRLSFLLTENACGCYISGGGWSTITGLPAFCLFNGNLYNILYNIIQADYSRLKGKRCPWMCLTMDAKQCPRPNYYSIQCLSLINHIF